MIAGKQHQLPRPGLRIDPPLAQRQPHRDILQPPNDSSVALRVALANPPETESDAPHEQG